MPYQRKIKAGDIVRDIRLGATDSELMEKHGLSAGGLQKLFKQMLAAGVVQPDELLPEIQGKTVRSSWKSHARYHGFPCTSACPFM
jgi:hypothetical protein